MVEQIKIADHGEKILQGNEACALAAVLAGCRFFAGYPITPATEIAEVAAELLPQFGGTFIQMEDELASVCSLVGARWGGKKSMTATSGPGFSLMQEGLGFGVTTETPMVIVNVQRGGPSTGQPTQSAQQDVMQARYGSHGDYEIIVLMPSSVQEMFDFTVKAFNLAERFRTPVIILADEIIGHMREKITVPEFIEVEKYEHEGEFNGVYSRNEKLIPPAINFYEGKRVLVEGQLHNEFGIRISHKSDESANLIHNLCNKITMNIDEIVDVDGMYEDSETLIISYGSVARPSIKAMKMAREKGMNVGFIKINSVWPFPEKKLHELAKNVKHIVVPEMNMGRYYREVKMCFNNAVVESLPLVGGELHTPEFILEKVEEVIGNE